MKNLVKHNNTFYLSDVINTPNGETRKVSGDYTILKGNYPHNRFKSNIVIYGRYSCPYCIGTVEFMKTKPALYKKLIYVEVDMKDEPMLSKDILLKNIHGDIGAHSTVPIIFDKGTFVGGSTDAKKYFTKD